MVIARQLIEHGAVNRAYLGVSLDSKFTTALAVELGLPKRLARELCDASAGSLG